MQVNSTHVEEIRALIASGDVSLEERRRTFLRLTGRETAIDDEKLIQAVAATDDDDDELFVDNVKKIEDDEWFVDNVKKIETEK